MKCSKTYFCRRLAGSVGCSGGTGTSRAVGVSWDIRVGRVAGVVGAAGAGRGVEGIREMTGVWGTQGYQGVRI